jgi:hypothetical protein
MVSIQSQLDPLLWALGEVEYHSCRSVAAVSHLILARREREKEDMVKIYPSKAHPQWPTFSNWISLFTVPLPPNSLFKI